MPCVPFSTTVFVDIDLTYFVQDTHLRLIDGQRSPLSRANGDDQFSRNQRIRERTAFVPLFSDRYQPLARTPLF